jgi:hypothetical protein
MVPEVVLSTYSQCEKLIPKWNRLELVILNAEELKFPKLLFSSVGRVAQSV